MSTAFERAYKRTVSNMTVARRLAETAPSKKEDARGRSVEKRPESMGDIKKK